MAEMYFNAPLRDKSWPAAATCATLQYSSPYISHKSSYAPLGLVALNIQEKQMKGSLKSPNQ